MPYIEWGENWVWLKCPTIAKLKRFIIRGWIYSLYLKWVAHVSCICNESWQISNNQMYGITSQFHSFKVAGFFPFLCLSWQDVEEDVIILSSTAKVMLSATCLMSVFEALLILSLILFPVTDCVPCLRWDISSEWGGGTCKRVLWEVMQSFNMASNVCLRIFLQAFCFPPINLYFDRQHFMLC